MKRMRLIRSMTSDKITQVLPENTVFFGLSVAHFQT